MIERASMDDEKDLCWELYDRNVLFNTKQVIAQLLVPILYIPCTLESS